MTGNICFAQLLIVLLMPLTLLLSSCGGGGGHISENQSNRGYNPGVGPFDGSGNYVERWADDRRKGRWWRKSKVLGNTSKRSVVAAQPQAKPQPVPAPAIVSRRPALPKPAVATATRRVAPVRSVAAVTPRAKPKPKPRPKASVKVKPKRKSPIRYSVKKGDTLWSISRRYNTTVTAIQRANGLKGTNLKIGRNLLIPRY